MVLFSESEPTPAHRTRSDPQQPHPASNGGEESAITPTPPPRAVTFSHGDVVNADSDPEGRKSRTQEERDAYYDRRASTRREFKRRASTLGEFYARNPHLLPQLPYSLRRGTRRWKVIGMGRSSCSGLLIAGLWLTWDTIRGRHGHRRGCCSYSSILRFDVRGRHCAVDQYASLGFQGFLSAG